MKKIFAVLFMFTFVFLISGIQDVSAQTSVVDFADRQKIKTGLLDSTHFNSTTSTLPLALRDNDVANYISSTSISNYSVYFKTPQKITYMYTKHSADEIIFRYDFYDSENVKISSFTPASLSLEMVNYLNLENVSRVDLVKVKSPSTTILYYELDFFNEQDLFAPSEINSFQYSFDDDLNLEMNYKLPVDSDFSHLKIYKNAELIEDNYKLDNYKISGISPLESNQFRFVSVDTSGNESAGFIQTVVSPDGPDFVAPQNILDLKQKVTGNAIQFNYILPTDDDFSHLQIYRNNELIIENHKINSFSDSELDYESNYNYVFKSVDTAGNVSEGVSISTVTGKEVDLIAPDVPTGLTVKNGNSALYVTWNPSPETDIEGYNLYINDVKYNGALIAGNSFTISNLENMKGYNIKVSAVDTSANESGRTAGVNGVPDEKAMPIVQVKNNLGAVATSTENWFSQLWLPLAFGVSIPLAFIIGSRVKSLFLA